MGKSRLPVLVAEATGGASVVVPVRPDWTDPAETMGYTDLHGRFRAGAVLRAARDAAADPGRFWTLVLDEMNLGRPEHYLAEVLSRIEARARRAAGRARRSWPRRWGRRTRRGRPSASRPNLGLVGTGQRGRERAHF